MKNMISFEMTHQLGLARQGRLDSYKRRWRTPAIIIPYEVLFFDEFTSKLFSSKENFSFSSFKQESMKGEKKGVKDEILKDLLSFTLSSQPTLLYSLFVDPWIEKIMFPKGIRQLDSWMRERLTPLLSERKEEEPTYFFPSIYSNHEKFSIPENNITQLIRLSGINEKKEEKEDDSITYKGIWYLSDNLNMSSVNRGKLKDFQYKGLLRRLSYYEEVVFPFLKEKGIKVSFILEIPFLGAYLNEEKNGTTHVLSDRVMTLISWIKRNREWIIGVEYKGEWDLYKNLEAIPQFLIEMNTLLPSDLIRILGGRYFPEDIALYTYLGIDLFDLRIALSFSHDDLYMGRDMHKWERQITEALCSCPACISPKGSSRRHSLLRHNLQVFINELHRVRLELENGTLRTYLEMKIHSNAMLASLLKRIDRDFGETIRKRYPLNLSSELVCIGPESYHRPEVLNFRTRVREHVYPHEFYEGVVLLPCSAHKPYSQSPSHKKMMKVLRTSLGKYYETVHQVIVTSPLGIVPRELESLYPAQHYDIPVSGEWDYEEIKETGEALYFWIKKYRGNNKRRESSRFPIYIHLDGGYLQSALYGLSHFQEIKQVSSYEYEAEGFRFIFTTIDNEEKEAFIRYILTERKEGEKRWEQASLLGILGSPMTRTLLMDRGQSETKLALLKERIEATFPLFKQEEKQDVGVKKLKTAQEILKNLKLTREEILVRSTLDYQFGKGTGDAIVQYGIIVSRGKNPYYSEIYIYEGAGKIIFGRLYRSNGWIKLTPSGAKYIFELGKHIVSIKKGTLSGTTIFRPLLASLSNLIHPGEDVMIKDPDGNYIGIGEMIQSSEDALNSNRGKICKLKKKYKPVKTMLNEMGIDDEFNLS